MSCAARHPLDRTPCEGPARAVTVTDRTGATITGCVRHTAGLLATLSGAAAVDGPAAHHYQCPMTDQWGDAARVAAALAAHMGPDPYLTRPRTRGRVGSIREATQ